MPPPFGCLTAARPVFTEVRGISGFRGTRRAQSAKPAGRRLGGPNYFVPNSLSPRVSKAGDDIRMVIEAFIHSRHIDVYVGVGLADRFDPLRERDDVHQLNVAAAAFFNQRDRIGALPPVASIGSSTISSRSCASTGSLQ